MKEISHEDKTQLNCSESPPPTSNSSVIDVNHGFEYSCSTDSNDIGILFSDSSYSTRNNSICSGVFDAKKNNSEAPSRRSSIGSKRRVTFASMDNLHNVHYFEKHPEEVEKRKFRRRVTSLLRSLLKRNSTDMWDDDTTCLALNIRKQ